MKKIIYVILVISMLIVGCIKDTNNSDSQFITKENQQTSQIQTSTKSADTTKDITTEETTTTTPEPTEAALVIREVLKNERPYIDVNNGYKETYRKDLCYFLGNNNVDIGWGNFGMFAVDNDRQREVSVIIRNLKVYDNHVNLEDKTFLILRYYEGKVYGYQCSQGIGIGRNEYFIWNSKYSHYMQDKEYKGGGKIEFQGDKIKYTYYESEKNAEAEQWIRKMSKDFEIEIIEDKDMCIYAESEYEKNYEYTAGDSNSVEDIEAYIY